MSKASMGTDRARLRRESCESGDVVREDSMVEYQSSGHLPAERLLQSSCDLNGDEGVAARVEEVRVLRHGHSQSVFPGPVNGDSKIGRQHEAAGRKSLDGRVGLGYPETDARTAHIR